MSYWIETTGGRFVGHIDGQRGAGTWWTRKDLGPATRSLLENKQASVGGVEQVVAECEGIKALQWLADLLRDVSEAVIIAGGSDAVAPGEEGEKKPEACGVALPDISMRPRDMAAIGSMLSTCDSKAQDAFRLLMEKWVRAGYAVGRTSNAIVLDSPHGDDANRIAMLLPGDSARPGSRPACICLFWENLRRQMQFPSAALDAYQAKVRKIVVLRETPSSAHIHVNKDFDTACLPALLDAMKKLARSICPELAGPPAVSKLVTPDNLRATLAMCSPQAQKVFTRLVQGWERENGTVQVKQPGRIYLRLKTKAHASGNYARLPRNFNLLVLAAPRGKMPAHIQATWRLANYYLDCVPAVVQEYEESVESLPGFSRKGTLSRVLVGDDFTLADADVLLAMVLKVKAAERVAP